MLAINSKREVAKCTPNLLPCEINHDGPVNASERYWKAEAGKDSSQVAYFRGRKLQGRSVKVPDRYRGAVLQTTDKVLPKLKQSPSAMDIDDEDEDQEEEVLETKVVEEMAEFDKILVWGHETRVDATEDPYTKAMEEWISLAEAMHSSSDETAAGNPSNKVSWQF